MATIDEALPRALEARRAAAPVRSALDAARARADAATADMASAIAGGEDPAGDRVSELRAERERALASVSALEAMLDEAEGVGAPYAAQLDAVCRKLNVTWRSAETDERVADAVRSASSRVASLLALPQDHWFTPEDGQGWALFLDACLYEFSDAMDDFVGNYGQWLAMARDLFLAAEEG